MKAPNMTNMKEPMISMSNPVAQLLPPHLDPNLHQKGTGLRPKLLKRQNPRLRLLKKSISLILMMTNLLLQPDLAHPWLAAVMVSLSVYSKIS
jgi:hypothetical protein